MNARRSGAGGGAAALALALALAVAVAVGCNTLAGIGEPRDRVAPALGAWEPQPIASTARITFVHTTPEHVYVGFSNGEIHFRRNDGVSPWSQMLDENPGCRQPMPKIPVTAMVIAQNRFYVGMASMEAEGTPTKIWHSNLDKGCWARFRETLPDVWSLSLSPISHIDFVLVTPASAQISRALGSAWEASEPGALPIGFAGIVTAFAEGVSPSGGARRAWLGDASGNVYFADGAAAAGDTAAISWTPVVESRFPARAVVAIALGPPDHPERVWVTFGGVHQDSLWYSPDNGTSWRNVNGGALPAYAGTLVTATFTAVSPVPGLDYVYVTALTPGSEALTAATSYWTAVDSTDWSRR